MAAPPPATPRPPADPVLGVADTRAAEFQHAIDGAIEAVLVSSPVWATFVGDHRFDDRFPDISKRGQDRAARVLSEHVDGLRVLAASAPERASAVEWGTDTPKLDAELLADHLQARVLSSERVRTLGRDPSILPSLVGAGMTSLVSHDYAPKSQRFRALVGRLEAVPSLAKIARRRIVKPTRPALENLAIITPGLVGNLREQLAKTPASALGGDPSLAGRVEKAAIQAADTLEAYAADVAATYPVEAATDDPIGPELWAELAKLKEGVGESPAEIRAMGEAELERLEGELQTLMKRTAKLGDSPAQYFARLGASAPEPEKLLAVYRDLNAGLEKWLKSTPFVTIPWDRLELEIVQTPPERRGVSFASMNVAGPLEQSLASAHFEVNIPEASMPVPKRDALRAFHAHGAIELISVHEALPGHYLQYLHLRQLRSKVRKLFRSATTGEGWAHYCEQAVLDAGYTGQDADVTRAFAIRMALQRAIRVIVDVGQNDGSLSMEEASKLLEKRAFLAPSSARMEARRALVAPVNMFTYTYGKLSIVRLKNQLQARDGDQFDLRAFHDRVISLGSVPIRRVAPLAFGL